MIAIEWKYEVIDGGSICVAVLMTLSDLERWEVRGQIFQADLTVQHCYNSDVSFLWEKWKLWPW